MDDDGLLAIEVDTDDYAETAAGDAPAVPRTFQSEENFQAQKATYTAKIHDGNLYHELIEAVPALGRSASNGKVKLSKKEVQLLGYAVGEMYYDGKYEEVIGLCGRFEGACVVEEREKEKVALTLKRWRERCQGRIEGRRAG